MRLGVAEAIVDGARIVGDVAIEDGCLVEVGLRPGGTGMAVPGFVDLQVNGFGGVDFGDADLSDYRRAGACLLETGVTAFQPTLISANEEDLVARLAAVPNENIGPTILGVHLEGPFLSAAHIGAHNLDARCDPDLAMLGRLLRAGPVSQMTLAPELPDGLAAIEFLRCHDIVVSCGHSAATADEAAAAFDAGATTVTHLFNAMRPFRHRDPGIAGAALARVDVTVQVIVDRHHLSDDTVRLAWNAAAGRLALVTDAMAGAGVGDGTYRVGGNPIQVRDGIATTSAGVLAGSTLTMIDAVRNLAALGVPLQDAIAAATTVPARILGRDDVGVLRPGRRADIIVLDDRLELKAVLVPDAPPLAA
jgi:N-acetylglucosamine-6-phosphate deacetylase